MLILFQNTEIAPKYKILIYGYVEEFQMQYPLLIHNPIGISNLTKKKKNIKPFEYYQILKSNFLEHISWLYLQGLKRFKTSI